MAKIFTFFDLYSKGFEFAKTEREQIDLINRLVDFCDDMHDQYMDYPELDKFEDSLKDIIDYANSVTYKHSVFIEKFEVTQNIFISLKKVYEAELESRPIISFTIVAIKGIQSLSNIFSNLIGFKNEEIEIIVLDCSGKKHIVPPKYREMNIITKTSEISDKLDREFELINLSKGRFIVPIDETKQLDSKMVQFFINVIKDNPSIGVTSDKNVVLDDESALPEYDGIAETQSFSVMQKSSFGFRKDFIDFTDENNIAVAKENADDEIGLYSIITETLVQEYPCYVFNSILTL